jgi:Domain of unknown function (DUF4184)
VPFPLAHPAAVLPLARFCPRLLDFPALIVGSLIPDLGYLFSRFRLGALSHQWIGILLFWVPVGMLGMWILYSVRSSLYHRSALPATNYGPLAHCGPVVPWSRSTVVIALSVAIGAATHVLWDSFTHGDGWWVQHLPALSIGMPMGAGHQWKLFEILWYISTIGGIAWLAMAYQNWRSASRPPCLPASLRVRLSNAFLLTIIALALALAHRLVQSTSVQSIVWDFGITVGSGLLVLGFVWSIERQQSVVGAEALRSLHVQGSPNRSLITDHRSLITSLRTVRLRYLLLKQEPATSDLSLFKPIPRCRLN